MREPFHYLGPPGPCVYLPGLTQRMEYVVAPGVTGEQYLNAMHVGWRRFGETLFRPRCHECHACISLRVDAARFTPDRSQRRAEKANQGRTHLKIGTPSVTPEKLALHHAFHRFQEYDKGWPEAPDDPSAYIESFIQNPFPTEEWCYFLEDRLVGVGYVDRLGGGLSGIYFFHDPAHRGLSLGTWNVLSLIRRAAELGLPHVYLGYYVDGCRSLEYKARFVPNEILSREGSWVPYIGPRD
jgi:arginyl-tRNA--protein-N-Asp/Glu arginylyltransferase